jgi:hypothetical protein
MFERLVLDPPAHLVEAAVGDRDHVEGIGDLPGVVEMGTQPEAVALMEVTGDRRDGGEEGLVSSREPAAQLIWRIAFDHVDEHAGVEVDEAGDVARVVLGVGLQERGLVDTEGRHDPDASGILHKGRAVIADRRHDRRPRDAEPSRERRHRPCVLADRPGALASRTGAQHLAGGELVAALGPGGLRTVGLRTGESALGPHETDRATAGGQVPNDHPQSVLRLRDHPAGRTTRGGSDRLDTYEQLVLVFDHRRHDEARKSEQDIVEASTVTHEGPPVLVADRQPRAWRGPSSRWWIPYWARVDLVTHPSSLGRDDYCPADSMSTVAALPLPMADGRAGATRAHRVGAGLRAVGLTRQ